MLTKMLGPKIRHYRFWSKKLRYPIKSAWHPFQSHPINAGDTLCEISYFIYNLNDPSP